MAKKRFIKNKSGDVVKVVHEPFDYSDDTSIPTTDDGSEGQPPQLMWGEAKFDFGGAHAAPNTVTTANTSSCNPNGTSRIKLRIFRKCCGCATPNFGSYPPCAPCPKPAGSIGASLAACEWDNYTGWPFDTITIRGTLYDIDPGFLEHSYNVGALGVRWLTKSTHYGANHVQPTGIFSNPQWGSFYLKDGSGPFPGDAIDWEITHTGMHDSSWPSNPMAIIGTGIPIFQSGNDELLIEGIFTNNYSSNSSLPGSPAEQVMELDSVTYSTPSGNKTYDPKINYWYASSNYNGGSWGLVYSGPPYNSYTFQGSAWPAGIITGYNHLSNASSMTPLSGGCDPTSGFANWPYAYKDTWIYDPTDPNQNPYSGSNNYTWPNAVTPGIIPNTFPCQTTQVFHPIGSSATIVDLNQMAGCGYQIKMASPLNAHIDLPNQSTFCEWKNDWVNGGSIPNSFDQRAVAWGYTHQQLESMACGCCDNLVDPGPSGYSYPRDASGVLANMTWP